MKKQILLGIVAAAALSACGSAPQAPMMQMAPRPVMMQAQKAQQNQQLLIRFHTEMDRSFTREFTAKYGLFIRNYVSSLNVYIADVDPVVGLKAADVVNILMQDRHVAHAEVNYEMKAEPIPQMGVSPIID